MGRKLYVGNLPYSATEQSVRDAFSKCGTVASVSIISDRDTGQSKGFGFVEMSDDAAGKKAIAELDGATVENRAISVTVAKPKEDRPARGNGGGGYNNGNNYNKKRY